MATEKVKNLYEIYEIPVFQYFVRLLCLGWIVFCYYMFQENQNLFMITGILAFILIFILPKRILRATKKNLIMETKYWLPLLNNSKTWSFEEIEEFKYDKVNVFANIFFFIIGIFLDAGTIDSSKLLLKIKNKRLKRIPAVGCHEENEDIVRIVNREMKRLR